MRTRVYRTTIAPVKILIPTTQKIKVRVRNPAKTSHHRRHHPSQELPQQEWYPGQNSSSEISALEDPQSSAQHVANIHTGGGDVPTKISAQLAIVTTMQHICAEHLGTHLSRAPLCVYCSSSEHSATQCHNRSQDNREQPCRTPEETRQQRFQQADGKILGNAQSDQHGHTGGQHFQGLHGKISEILDLTNLVMLTLIILGVARTMVAIRGKMQQALVDKIRIIFLVSEVMGTNKREHHSTMPGSMRDTISSTLYPCTHQPHH